MRWEDFGLYEYEQGCVRGKIPSCAIGMHVDEGCHQVFKAFDLQLVEPMKPYNTQTYGVFLDDGLLVKATERS
jgi:hypothetical protein